MRLHRPFSFPHRAFPHRWLRLSAIATITVVAGIEACASVAPQPSSTTTPEEVAFGPSTAAASAPPSAESLLAEALTGIGYGNDAADGEEGTDASTRETLGARFEARTLRMPHPARGATARFNFEGGKRGWVTALPRAEILATPAYADGKVFLGGGFASHRFFAFDAFQGELVWSMAAPDGGPTAAITMQDRVLYNTESCTLFAADMNTGAKLWSRWLGDPLMSQPAAAGEFVLSAYPKDGAHQFGAFRASDGEPVWSIPIPADVIQAPQVQGTSVYFATMDGTAFRVRWRDGRVQWQRQVGATSAMWVSGERVMVSARANAPGGAGSNGVAQEQPVVLHRDNGRILHRGEAVPAPYLSGQSRDRNLHAGQAGAWGQVPHGQHLGLRNVASGWAFQGSTPAVAGGRVYTSIGSQIRAHEIENGELVWQRDYGDGHDAQALSPPTVVGGQLVVGTVDGQLYFVDIDTGMIVRGYDLGQPVVFQPIVAQGWVYVATGEGNLIGLEIADPAFDGWHMWGGNAQHNGPVEGAGEVHPALLASLERPGKGTLRVGAFETTPAEEGEFEGEMDALHRERQQAQGEEFEAREDPTIDDLPDLPTVSTEVAATIEGFIARVSVTQSFENPHDKPIEAVYLFPLPEDAAVDAMEMRIGERRIRARIRQRQAARRIYEEARTGGRRAALLEQQRPDLFAQRVANIQPGERIDVHLEYVQTLPFADGTYTFTYPLTAPPPGVAPDAPTGDATPQGTQLAIALQAGMTVSDIASPSHPLDITRRNDGNEGNAEGPFVNQPGAVIRTRDEDAREDFILRYKLGGDVPDAAVRSERMPVRPNDDGEANGYFSLLVQPPALASDASAAPSPRAITFVVDRSSSMHGAPLRQAKAVVRSLIEGAAEQDRINVVTVSDRLQSVGSEPQPAREIQSAALAMLDTLEAAGSSDLMPALEAALDAPAPDGYLPMVVLVSDGYIGDEGDVLRTIARHLSDKRLYALGVGSAVNRLLLSRATEIGRGRVLYGALSDEATDLSTRMAQMIDRPLFTDVEIDWGGLDVQEVYPRRLPDLFAGAPITLHGRYDQGGSATVTVRGTMNGQRFERRVPVTLAALPSRPAPSHHASPQRIAPQHTGETHASLWARAAVRDRMNRLYLRDDPALIEEVTALGLRHHLVTQWTSFVAVDDRPASTENNGRATISPARVLPGDPEIRVPAPADARAVTLVLPFGETVAAAWEPDLERWTGRFLVPSDAEEGSYPIDILITLADGTPERMRVWYTVDASAPVLDVSLEVADLQEGQEHQVQPQDGTDQWRATPGSRVRLIATQRLTEADLAQVGLRTVTPRAAQLLHDTQRVEARLPDGTVLPLEVRGPDSWSVDWTVPDSEGELSITLVVVDMAANVRTQTLTVTVAP